jgi:hypothetical protein
MEQLIELLKQIQELAGAGIDALKQVGGSEDKGGSPDEGGRPEPGGKGPNPDENGGAEPQKFQGR